MNTNPELSTRLNRFIANSGVCTRREADGLIKSGGIKVNGEVIDTLGVMINPQKDRVEYQGKVLSGGGFYYILLNKSKGFGKGGKTVSQLIRGAIDIPLTQIGELGANDLGLVLFTNDPDLRIRISNSNNSKLFLYHIKLNHAVDLKTIGDLKRSFSKSSKNLLIGDVAFVDGSKGIELGITTNCADVSVLVHVLHSAELKVVSLERVLFLGLTKKDVPRGKWRFLLPKEASFLQMV